jgi:hypothetical protein
MMEESRSQIRRLPTVPSAANALLLSILLLLAWFYVRARFLAPISFDEEFALWGGWIIMQGGVPYRDFFEPKPPVIFVGNYLGLALFGFKDSLFRIVPTVLVLASIAFFYLALLKRKLTPWLAMLLTAQVALWFLGPEFHDSGLNDSESYGFAFTLLGFSLGSISSSLNGRARAIAVQLLSGACFALAIFSKELFVFSVAPAWLLAVCNRQNGRWDLRHLLLSGAGALVVVSALLIYLITHSALGPYLDLLGFYRTFAANYCIDIGRFPRVSGFSVLLVSWKFLHGAFYNFRHLAFILALWVALLFLIRRSPARRGELAIASLSVVLGMVAISVGHCFWMHYFLLGTTGLVLLSLIGAEALSSFLSKKGAAASVISFAVLSALLFFVGYAPTKDVLKKKALFQHAPWDPVLHETIERHSRPGDYILTTEGPLLYVVTNRKNPLPLNSFVDETLPFVTAENRVLKMELLRANLEKNLPKVCYFPPWLRPRQDKYHELLFDPLLRKHDYTKVNNSVWHLPEAR